MRTKARALVRRLLIAATIVAFGPVANLKGAERVSAPDKPTSFASRSTSKAGNPSFMSPHSNPIAIRDGRVYVANTPSDTVDVIDAKTRRIVARVPVGIDPVSIAIRPDGKEAWVSNHVSDSISVIDIDPKNSTHLQVVATIQDFDPRTKATRFDEPVGIAFASNQKAYIALSSENKIAVVNVQTRKIEKRLTISAQDPRAIVVRGNRLYVAPFESNNKTQLSGGNGKIDGELVTFNAHQHSIAVNNVLSLGHVVDIVKHPRVPDRDLYLFDTENDKLVKVVDTLGTLLYGLTVDSKGRVYIAQTDARNDANGRSGTKKHGLKELGNRAFLNRITCVDPARSEPEFIDLEPLPPKHPSREDALATPFAIEISPDDSMLVATAAGSDKVFTVDTKSGRILGQVRVDSVPRGIALQNQDGELSQAWVLNAVANTVSLVDLSDPTAPKMVSKIALEDPTHEAFKRGRIAFNTASASTTGTFSCASCHPDGHTDQLLWVLKTPIVTGGNQIMPRSTMPVRGLRDTAPFHWDGIPGDPYGGNNSANIHGSDPPNSSVDDPASTTRNLIDGGLAATMALVGDKTMNDEGKAGQLSAAERDDMAIFLLGVPYPPAQRRSYTNVVSKRAIDGFKLFHIDGDLDGKPRPNVCGNCHRMPFWVSTNTPGTGMDAPTWRGAYDRFLILPQGRLNIIDFDFYRRVADTGQDERKIWQFSWGGRRRFDPIWNMVIEGSTGFSGAFARQLTLSVSSADDEASMELLNALEKSAKEEAIVLEGEGVLIDAQRSESLLLSFDGKKYVQRDGGKRYSRAELIKLAAAGKFVGTVTARHGKSHDVDHPQPGLWTLSSIHTQSGRQRFPVLHKDKTSMTINGRHVADGAHIVVNGRRVEGSVKRGDKENLIISLAKLPDEGMHLIQLQNPGGLFSNDFIFHVVADAKAAAVRKAALDKAHRDWRRALPDAVAKGDVEELRQLLRRGARLGAKNRGSTVLATAALHGQLDAAKFLIRRRANVNAKNDDGNTPLHIAAFLGRAKMVELFLEKGASKSAKNRRGETPLDTVRGEWDNDLEKFYKAIARGAGITLDLEEVKKRRGKVAELLQE